MKFDLGARISRAKQGQRGLTLIELIVVLVILVGLGGLLVPVIRNALTRTHVSTCAQSFSEITNSLNRIAALTGGYGDRWSTGVFGAGANADSAVNAFLADGTTARPGAALAIHEITADEGEALEGLGIANVVDHADPTTVAGYNVTFNNGIDPTTTPEAITGADVIELSPAQAAGLYLPAAGPTQTYIWLGIDKSYTLLGTEFPEPPVHFGDNPDGGLPDQTYSRFGAIFLIDDGDAGIVGDGAAEFKRVTYSLDGEGFETSDDHIGIYWDEVDRN
ncbi:MAG: type II secretion system protein [Planctomycetota bacterium]